MAVITRRCTLCKVVECLLIIITDSIELIPAFRESAISSLDRTYLHVALSIG